MIHNAEKDAPKKRRRTKSRLPWKQVPDAVQASDAPRKRRRGKIKAKPLREPRKLNVRPATKGQQSDKRITRQLEVLDKRHTAWKLYVEEGYTESDIASVLGVSQGRVSKYITETAKQRHAEINEYVDAARLAALDRVQLMRKQWHERAATSERAAEVLLRWEERGDKINGLYVTRTEDLTRRVAEAESEIDITLLNAEQLGWLEVILTVGARKPKQVTDATVVAEQDATTPTQP